MFNKKRQKGTYGVVGLGRFGYALAEELADSGADVLVLDRDEEMVRKIREHTENAFVVKNLDKEALEETGIQNCDVVVVCITDHMEASILTVLHLVSLGVPQVIAKAAGPEHGEILQKLGAEVVFPEHDMAIRLAHRLETSRMLDFVQLSERLNISKLMIPENAVGKTVVGVNLRAAFGGNIIAIESGGRLLDSVEPGYTFRRGDILYVAASRENLDRLAEWAERD